MKPDFSKPVGDYLKVWWFESGTSTSNLPWLDLENPNEKNDKDLKCIAVFKFERFLVPWNAFNLNSTFSSTYFDNCVKVS